ncbi:MAG: hypothetical protein LUC91_02880, partial [Prevotella sp.]|nr:hypothetical protein [Prevotella sp.]
EAISPYNEILIIAPGSSINEEKEKVTKAISPGTCVISVNFIPELENCKTNFIFLTNTKRYDAIKSRMNSSQLIITSNLIRDVGCRDYTVSYNDLVRFNDEYCDDSTLMLLNLLVRVGVKAVSFAGFDGSHQGVLKYFDGFPGRSATTVNAIDKIKRILNTVFAGVNKRFITDSQFADNDITDSHND